MLNMIEVVKIDGMWHVRRIQPGGPPEMIVAYARKKHAMIAGRAIAIDNEAELVEKNRKGVIVDRSSFGNDPIGRG